MAANDNTEKVIMLFEAQNKDVLRKLNQIERQNKQTFSKGAKQVKSFNMQMKKSSVVAASMAKSLASFGGLAIAGGLAGISSSVKSIVEEASRLAKTADLLGVTTDELQRMTYGFELAGVSVSETENALQQFGKRLSEAESKGGLLADILEANGVQIRNAAGQMKPLSELLKEYATLIKNAGSEQEKLSLANEAFGRSGSRMVLALRNGEQGVRDLMSAADDAGGVLDEEILRKAEKIDDQFAKMARTVSVNVKGAILGLADAISSLIEEEQKSETLSGAALRKSRRGTIQAKTFSDLFGGSGEKATPGAKGRKERRDAMRQENEELGKQLDLVKEIDEIEKPDDKPTVIPPKPGGGRRSTPSDAEREAEKVRQVIEALQAEQAAIGMSITQQRIMNELRTAGAGATDAQKQQIEQLVTEIDKQNARMEAAQYIQDEFKNAAMSSFGELTAQINTGNAALDTLIQNLINATAQAALFGEGPLAGLFGGGAGGGGAGGFTKLLSGLFSGFTGFWADGGHLGAGKWGIAGEAGPEIVRGPANIVPFDKMKNSGGTMSSSQGVSVKVENYGTSKSFDVQQLSEGEIRIIANDEIRKNAPSVVASDLSNPNGRVSKSLTKNTNAQRKRA